MPKINVLSFEVANLIAAGEVVDRPASVIKELLENSIDAGASKITVEIRRGGVSLMRVTDDGCGISPEDMPIAIKRHATSKIKDKSDLDGIVTLGFRGEALAATAAVSKMTIVSKTRENESGTVLSSEGGNVTDISEVGCADGTSVLVEELFYNVPARRKFLKKDATEMLACQVMVEKVALSHPDISFTFVADRAVKFSTAGDGNLRNTIYAVEGREFAEKITEVNYNDGGISVVGYIGRSDNVRGNRNFENIFINHRFVRSKTATAALEQAYSSFIAPGKFPVCALFIDIRPELVDVNVHPSKLEVKFSDERKIFEAVYYAVKNALESDVYRPGMNLGAGGGKKDVTRSFVPVKNERGDRAAEQLYMKSDTMAVKDSIEVLKHYRESAPPEPRTAHNSVKNPFPSFSSASGGTVMQGRRNENKSAQELFGDDGTVYISGTESKSYQVTDMSKSYSNGFGQNKSDKTESTGISVAADCGRDNIGVTGSDETCVKGDDSGVPCNVGNGNGEYISPINDSGSSCGEKPTDEYISDKKYRYIGELFNCYLVVEREKEILLIDKHAAHERINFEEMKRTLASDGRIASQNLMIPICTRPGGEAVSALEEYREEIESIGFICSVDKNDGTVCIEAIPDNISAYDAEGVLVNILDRLAQGTGNAALAEKQRMERALYQIACKASIKGGRIYDDAHIMWLIDKVMKLPDIKVCPHGRPIAYILTKNEIDRQFNRIE